MFANCFEALAVVRFHVVNLSWLHAMSSDVEHDLLLNSVCLLWTELEISDPYLLVNVLRYHMLNSLIDAGWRIITVILGN